MTTTETKVALLEQRYEDVHSQIQDIKLILRDTADSVNEIRLKIAQQNGSIPHLTENVKLLLEGQNKLQEVLLRNSEKNDNGSALKLKVKILWGVAAFVAAGIGTYILNLLLTK